MKDLIELFGMLTTMTLIIIGVFGMSFCSVALIFGGGNALEMGFGFFLMAVAGHAGAQVLNAQMNHGTDTGTEHKDGA